MDDHAQLGQERDDVSLSRSFRFYVDICRVESNSKSQWSDTGSIRIWARIGSVEALQLVKTERALSWGCLSGVGIALTSPSATVMNTKKRRTSRELNIMKRGADERGH